MSQAHTIDKRDAGAAELDEHFATVPRDDAAGLTVDNGGIDWLVVGGMAVNLFLLAVVGMLGCQLVRWVAVVA
ncbi:hypothetical protein [Rhodococcoides fascians]|uniref:hypothetical protein n=1 Tax=Rhodococcoides fascians TaxID=1828 RepID=UPI000562221D|nr:hypothetical protein [Rhodococcus fascians]